MDKKKYCKSSTKHNQIVLYLTVKFGDLFTCDPNPHPRLLPTPATSTSKSRPATFRHTHHNAAHSPSSQLGPQKQKRITQDCSRIAKGIAMTSGILVESGGRHCFILPRDNNKKNQKNLRRKLPETGRSQATNLETQKQTERIEMHQSQVNMCFLRGLLRWLTEQKNASGQYKTWTADCGPRTEDWV